MFPPWPDVQNLFRRIAIVVTSRGKFEMEFFKDAPLATYNFYHLAKQGFYNGSVFSRVIPHFVVQGGDPRGDGFGEPGYVIPDEISDRDHERGTVGMASFGKDTAGSQFFINTVPTERKPKWDWISRYVGGSREAHLSSMK